MRQTELIERYEVIDLPRREYDKIRILLYLILASMFLLILYLLVQLGGLQILYSNIFILSFFIFALSCFVICCYLVINSLYIQHPILVISPRHVYLSTKNLGRSPELYDTKLNPTHDMQLVIVQDSHTGKYRVMLEERILLDLGLFPNLALAQQHRQSLKSTLSKFFPELFISSPPYKKI
ncbi:MAG: hypothetical protein ACTSSO_02785 [Candidatus Hodarchaeales archaeon]